MSDFKPSVISNGDRDWKGIMPHRIRSKAWDVLYGIQDYIVDFEANPTELFVSVNRGYEPREGFVLLAVSIYLAMNDLEALLSCTSIEEHLANINKQIQFESALKPGEDVYKPVEDTLKPGEVSPYIKSYLYKTIKVMLEKKNSSYSSIIEDNIKILLKQAKKAKNRLTYYPASPETISVAEKSSRLAYCDYAIGLIENALTIAEEINDGINAEKEKISDEIKDFLAKNNSKILSCGQGLEQILNHIEKLTKKANTQVDNYIKSNNIQKLVESVQDICPPEKK